VCKSTILFKVIVMSGFKDKDLMADGCGKTKHREYSDHQRPPRMQ
jgi:hypothetical protein